MHIARRCGKLVALFELVGVENECLTLRFRLELSGY